MQRYPYLKVQRCFQFSYLIYNISVSMFNFVDEIFSIFTRRAWCAAPRCWTTCRQDWCWNRRVASCSEAERRLTHSDTSALTVPAPPVIASLSVGRTHRILIISMIQSISIFFLCPPSTSIVALYLSIFTTTRESSSQKFHSLSSVSPTNWIVLFL